jgi:hypothetical protein
MVRLFSWVSFMSFMFFLSRHAPWPGPFPGPFLEPIMGKGLIGFGHFVDRLPLLDGGAAVVGRID